MILFVGQIARDMREPRGVPGGRLPRGVRHDRQMGGRDRRRRAHPGDRGPRLPCRRRSGRPGPVVIALPEDMLTSASTSPTRRAFEPVETSPGPRRDGAACRSCCGPPSGRSLLVGGSRWREARVRGARAFRRALRHAGRDHVPPRARCSTRCIPTTPAISASAPTRSCSARIKDADLVVLVGGRLGEMPSQSYTPARHSGAAARRSSMSIPAPRNSAASISRRWRSTRRRPPSAPRSTGLQPPNAIAWARRRRGRARRLSRLDRKRDRGARARVNLGEIVAVAARHAAGRRDRSATAPAISRPGCTAIYRYPRLRHAARARPRARWAMACRPRSRPSGCARAHRRRVRRRRRLPDDRPGIRHRRAVRARRSSSSSSTTACTARSACIRSANIPAASRAPSCATRISPRSRAPTAATARRWSRPPSSRPPSSARVASGKPAILHLKVDPQAITPTTTLDGIRAKALAGTGRA